VLVWSVLALAIVCARELVPVAPTAPGSFGRGTPIVLVHGLGSSREDWLATARLLALHHRVVLVDLPGHGESNMPEPFSLEGAVATLQRALDDVPGGPPILVGHSLGGLVAAAAAIESPRRLAGLVLVESALRPQLPPDQRARWLDRLDHDYDAVLRDAYLGFGRDSLQGEALYRRVAALDRRAVSRWIRLAWSADLTPRVAEIDVPVLAVLAERSWGIDEPWEAVAEALGYTGLTRLRAARVRDSGHFVMLDQPSRLASLVHGFATDPEGLKLASAATSNESEASTEFQRFPALLSSQSRLAIR
jgi:pimeloyl-ACP methyl ester carboxylesterase